VGGVSVVDLNVLEVDQQEAITRAEDANLTVRPYVPYHRPHACLALFARDAAELVTFVLTVAPYLDGRFETVNGELDFHPAWENVQQVETAPAGYAALYYWPRVRPVRDLNHNQER